MGRKFTFQANRQVIRNMGDNDSLEQLNEMIPSVDEHRELLMKDTFEVIDIKEDFKKLNDDDEEKPDSIEEEREDFAEVTGRNSYH